MRHFIKSVSCRKIILLISCVAICFVPATVSMATDISDNYCSPFHKGIRKVILTYEAKLPSDNLDASVILGQVKKLPERILHQGHISVEIYPSSESVPALVDGDLLIKLTYAYAPRNAFSIPLQDDYVAAWLEQSRYANKSKKQVDPAVRKTDVIFYKGFDQVEPHSGSELTLAGMLSNTLSNLSCDIIRFSASIDCEDRKNFVHPKFKKIEPCLGDPPENNFINKILKGSQQ